MSRDTASKTGPKPKTKTTPAARLLSVGSTAAGGLPEPDPMLDADELAVFQQLLSQTGAHLKRADSAPLSLLARQLVEERSLKKAMNAIDASVSPNDYLGARRALTSLQTASANSMKLLGIGPKARASSVTLQPLPGAPTGKAAATDALPFINDTKLSDKAVAPLAGVTWCGVALDEAEKQRQADGAALPSLACLCSNQHRNQILLRLMGSNANSEADMGPELPAKLYALICRICGEEPI